MSDLEGLWTIQFEVAGEWRTGGIVTFDRGRLTGGDSHYYYFGHYAETGSRLKGEARIVHYAGPLATGFGSSPDFVVLIDALHSADHISGSIQKPGAAMAKLAIRCARREKMS